MKTLFAAPLFAAVLAGCAVQAQSQPQPQPQGPARPVLVELFTSQGCSSCPPADTNLEIFSHNVRDVVAVTRPVTYWDRLGWKDTLAREENTQLQRAYARRGGKGAGVYTPQAVVQGGAAAVGGNYVAVSALIAQAKRAPQPALAVSKTSIAIDGRTDAPAQVTLLALRKRTTVRIGRGENGGRTVRYANVLLGERALGEWRGGAKRFAVPALTVRGADEYAVVVRQGPAGRVLAARYL